MLTYNTNNSFSKYIGLASSVNRFSSNSFFSNAFSNEKNISYFVFQYNSLDNNFIHNLRSKFFKFNISIISGKKGIMRFFSPIYLKNFFFNSSFVVSFPAKNFENLVDRFTAITNFIEHYIPNQTARFSFFPIVIYFNGIIVPIEYIYYFSHKPFMAKVFFDNRLFCTTILLNFFNFKLITFNKSFFKK